MNTEIRIDTEYLRCHIDLLNDEQKLVLELLEHLNRVQLLADEDLRNVLNPLILKAEKLSEHFALMSEALEDVCCIFEKVSKEMSHVLHNYLLRNIPSQDR